MRGRTCSSSWDAIASERDQWTEIPGPPQARVFRRTGPLPPADLSSGLTCAMSLAETLCLMSEPPSLRLQLGERRT